MTIQTEVLYEILGVLKWNNFATWVGAIVALVALVIDLIALFKR